MKIELNIRQVHFVAFQLVAVTLIIILGLLYYIFGYEPFNSSIFIFLRLLDVGSEQSIPTYFSALNLLLSSVLLFIIYSYEKTKKRKGKNYWIFLAILFFSLSVDESISIHEKFANVYYYLSISLKIIPSLFITRNWLPFGFLFVFIIGLVLLPFYKLLPKKTLYSFLISGTIFLTGAIGFEFLGSIMLKTGYVESDKELIYLIRRIFEEGFEMYGIAIFNCVLFHEISNKKISLIISNS